MKTKLSEKGLLTNEKDLTIFKMASDKKLITALYKIAQENFSVTDDTVLDKLYFHIVNSSNFKENKSTLLPQLFDWLGVIIQRWTNKVLFDGVQVFSVRFIGNIGSDMIGFQMLQDQNVLNFLENLISSHDIQKNGCLIASLINTFEMFLNHEGGWKWITESKIWRVMLNVSYENRCIYTKRAVIKFISQILITNTNYVTALENEIMSFICEPLVSNHLLNLGTCGEGFVDTYDGIMISEELLNAAKYLCDILEILLGNNSNLPVKLNLVYMANGNLPRCESVIALHILDKCSSSQEHMIFSSLLFMVEVSNLPSQNTLSCISTVCCLEQVYFQIHCIIKSLTLVGHLRAIPNFCATCLRWLSKIKQKKKHQTERCTNCDYFESTILFCLGLFLISFELSINRLNSDLKEFTIGICLSKKVFEECCRGMAKFEHRTSFQFNQLALSALTRCYDLIDNHKNFACLLGMIIEFFHTMTTESRDRNDLIKPTILQLLDLISKIVEKNCLQIMRILHSHELESYVSIFISGIRTLVWNSSDVRVTVLSLQALTKFLRLKKLRELFVENKHKDRHIIIDFYINPILVDTLKSEHWEVRDTVLEVFQTVIEMESFLPVLSDKKPFSPSLVKMIFDIASDDESAYVKASALNFFCKAVRHKFVEDVILPNSLLDLAKKSLLEDNMEIARKSACNLIAALYISYIPAGLLDSEEIFETVFLASTKDLDWEVKESTLSFWQCTIEKDLLVEIVAFENVLPPFMNTPEARRDTVLKIIEVLEALGESGCLKAIWLSLNDDCDLKVSQKAQSIVESLEKLNERWGFLDDVLNYQEGGEEINSIESCSRRLTPKKFFSLLNNENWREKIDSRKQWIENTCDNLPSLLDHILDDNIMDDLDHNVVDCY